MTTNANGSYIHFRSPVKSYLLSVLAIVVSAAPAVWLAWLAMYALGFQGIPLALATALTAMILSVFFFAALVAIGKKLGIVR